MTNQSAASLGFIVAGMAFAFAFQPWPGNRDLLVAGVAGVALIAFGLRRYDALESGVGSPVAGVAGLALLLVGIASVIGMAVTSGGSFAVVPAATSALGVLVIGFAYADWRGVSRSQLGAMFGSIISNTVIGIAGLLAIVAWSGVIAGVLGLVVPGEVSLTLRTALATIALGLGTGTVALLYLYSTDHGFAFIDVKRPDLRDGGYILGGVLVLVGLNLGLSALFKHFGVEAAQHSIIRTAESSPEILLVLVPLAYLVIGPGEELLYRNIIQKSLYDTFSRPAAVLIASGIFAGVHLFAFSGGSESVLATMNTLLVVFVLSIVLGVVYERTENVVAAALVHGTFDAIAFLVVYAQLTGFM